MLADPEFDEHYNTGPAWHVLDTDYTNYLYVFHCVQDTDEMMSLGMAIYVRNVDKLSDNQLNRYVNDL